MRNLIFVLALSGCTIEPFAGAPLPPVDDEFVPRPVDEADIVFDDTVIHEISISMEEEALDAMQEVDDREVEVRALIEFDTQYHSLLR